MIIIIEHKCKRGTVRGTRRIGEGKGEEMGIEQNQITLHVCEDIIMKLTKYSFKKCVGREERGIKELP
jgi:hypothetical protein